MSDTNDSRPEPAELKDLSRAELVEVLRACHDDPEKIRAWNDYRKRNPDWQPDLSDSRERADLAGLRLGFPDAELKMINVNLSGALLFNADLSAAELRGANLSGADLFVAELSGANLGEANLAGAILNEAVLSDEAMLNDADLSGAKLIGANLSGAILWGTNLSGANVLDVIYDRKKMRGNYRGIRVATCYGNPLFKRDAEDQDFLDTFESQIETELQVLKERKNQWTYSYVRAYLKWDLFRIWGWIDYGRSILRVAVGALIFASLFALVYYADRIFGWSMLDYSESADSWLTPLYYSIVTYTTLGFGDVTPGTAWGELLVMIEVIFGYVTLGLLLAVLANKVARRS